MTDHVLYLNAGHAEYLPPTATIVWAGQGDGSGDAYAAWARHAQGAPTLDADEAGWCTIVRLTGTLAALHAALTDLLTLLIATPHGDDDVYDYWPAGVRLAHAFADALYALDCDHDHRGPEVNAVVRAALYGTAYDPADLGL